MAGIEIFTCNAFAENSYVIYGETGECIIIDPGFSSSSEEQRLLRFLEAKELIPTRLILTHCHIDHILGCTFVCNEFQLLPEFHTLELPILQSAKAVANMYGLRYVDCPSPKNFLEEGDSIVIGNTTLEVIFTPGHSPGSICFVNKQDNWCIGGDVLFKESIGRTDLPGGNHATLLDSIRKKLFNLNDTMTVFPGHGPATTIEHEKTYNPFLNGSI